VSDALITARRPEEVAREVEQLVGAGYRRFVVALIDHGGMLDLERLGAARYAAGLQSAVELEDAAPAAVAATR
jgi:L-alanine-DL-glutamate epimerase-like enolase superfamily enzyme